MWQGRGGRRLRAERRLFEAADRLEQARAELGLIEAELEALCEQADEAKVRAVVTDTTFAVHASDEATRHAEQMERTRETARRRVVELERATDELIGKLVN